MAPTESTVCFIINELTYLRMINLWKESAAKYSIHDNDCEKNIVTDCIQLNI